MQGGRTMVMGGLGGGTLRAQPGAQGSGPGHGVGGGGMGGNPGNPGRAYEWGTNRGYEGNNRGYENKTKGTQGGYRTQQGQGGQQDQGQGRQPRAQPLLVQSRTAEKYQHSLKVEGVSSGDKKPQPAPHSSDNIAVQQGAGGLGGLYVPSKSAHAADTNVRQEGVSQSQTEGMSHGPTEGSQVNSEQQEGTGGYEMKTEQQINEISSSSTPPLQGDGMHPTPAPPVGDGMHLSIVEVSKVLPIIPPPSKPPAEQGEVGHVLTVNSLKGASREKAREIVGRIKGFQKNVLPSKEAILHKIEFLSADIRRMERENRRREEVMERIKKRVEEAERSGKTVEEKDIEKEETQGDYIRTVSDTTSLITSLYLTNNAKARSAQATVLDSCIPPFPGPTGTESSPVDTWKSKVRNVAGPSNAVYSHPMTNPLYDVCRGRYNNKTLRKGVVEVVKERRKNVMEGWVKGAREFVKVGRRYAEDKAKQEAMDRAMERIRENLQNGGRGRNRGGEIEGISTDVDIEQKAKEVIAKEMMRKRIENGKISRGDIPRQVWKVEKERGVTFIDLGKNRRVLDGWKEEKSREKINPWSDIEKAIFLDKFCQWPKNFRKIATFLRNKTTADSIAFYYNSKKFINYKLLLREYTNRRRFREGTLIYDVDQWSSTLNSVRAVGANCRGGKKLKFYKFRANDMPRDNVFRTGKHHPPRDEVRDALVFSIGIRDEEEDEGGMGGRDGGKVDKGEKREGEDMDEGGGKRFKEDVNGGGDSDMKIDM